MGILQTGVHITDTAGSVPTQGEMVPVEITEIHPKGSVKFSVTSFRVS